MSAPGAPVREGPPPLHGAALVIGVMVLAMANFMAVLDMTIVNISIPHIAGSLAISPTEGTWAITSYAVAEAIMVPLTGWLAARFGPVRVFLTGAAGYESLNASTLFDWPSRMWAGFNISILTAASILDCHSRRSTPPMPNSKIHSSLRS